MSSTSVIPWAGTVPSKFVAEINQSVSILEALAPAEFSMAEFNARMALQFAGEPKLYECKATSVINAMMNCITLGLKMGTECVLVPFKDECTLLVQFEGWMRRFAQIPGFKRCVTDVVRKGDEFDYDPINVSISHKPNLQRRTNELQFAYCVIQFLDGNQIFEVLDKDDIARHRSSARQGGNTPAWNSHESEMWRKSAVKAIAARYGGQLGLTGLINISNTADVIEYQHTGPAEKDVRAAVLHLFGETSGDLFHREEKADEIAPVPPPVPGAEVMIEDQQPIHEMTESDIKALKDRLIRTAKDLEMTTGAVKKLVWEAGGGTIELANLTNYGVLAKIDAGLRDRLEANVEKQT